MRYVLLISPVLLVAGCLHLPNLTSDGRKTTLVPSNPFGASGPVPGEVRQVSYEPAGKGTALRVYTVGQQLLTANPEIGMKPLFATYGTDKAELFHMTHAPKELPKETLQKTKNDGRVVYITEGLVKRCKNDAELAALLAHELAEMVVAREALAPPAMRQADDRPPIHVTIGNGTGVSGTEEFHMLELARYEKKRRRRQQRKLPLPDAQKLAQHYLEKAGYPPQELEAVAPLFDEAERTYSLEKQFKQMSSGSNWTVVPK